MRKIDYYKKILNTYLRRGNRPDQEKTKVSVGIIIKFKDKILLEVKDGAYHLLRIDNIDRNKHEDYFVNIFEKNLSGIKYITKSLGQSGLRPEKEIYFFLVKLNDKTNINSDLLSLFTNDSQNYKWINLNEINQNNINPNHIPFIKME